MEPPRRHLSFPPNFKPSRALNHQQSDLQEAPICQPCPPAMEFRVELSLWGHNFSFLGRKNREVLEIDFFLPPHTYLGSWQTSFEEKVLGTLGDAFRGLTLDIVISQVNL